jgi:hypothetical protein
LFAYAVPSAAALRALGGPLVEAGCGSGYWAALLREGLGADVLAFDKDLRDNEYHGNVPPFTRVEQGTAKSLARCSDRTLFLCYPPPEDPFALDCLAHFSGERVAVCGEWRGDTGTRQFEEKLARGFQLEAEVPLPNWSNTRYSLTLWRRRSKSSEGAGWPIGCANGACLNSVSRGSTRAREVVLRRCRYTRELLVCSPECLSACRSAHQAALVGDEKEHIENERECSRLSHSPPTGRLLHPPGRPARLSQRQRTRKS